MVVCGYSLGAQLAVRFAAGPVALPLRGLIGLGTAWSLPDTTRMRMDATGSDPPYAELAQRLAWVADPAQGDRDEVVVIRRCYGAASEPRTAGVYTARTWWHSRGPEAIDAIAHLHVGNVPAPVLLVQGDRDVLVDPADAERLAEAARAAGNPDVTVAPVPGVGHSFHGGEDVVVGTVGAWLAARA